MEINLKLLPDVFGLLKMKFHSYYPSLPRKLAIHIRPVLLSKAGHPNMACSIIKRWPSKYGLFCYRNLAIQIRPVLLSEGAHPNKTFSVIESWTSKYGLLYYQKVAIQIKPVLWSTDGHPNTACNNGVLKAILHQAFYIAMIRLYLWKLLFLHLMTLSLLHRSLTIVESISNTGPCRDYVEFILYCPHVEHSVAMPDSDITKAVEQPIALSAQIDNVIILLIAWLFEADLHRFTVPGNPFQLLVHIQWYLG